MACIFLWGERKDDRQSKKNRSGYEKLLTMTVVREGASIDRVVGEHPSEKDTLRLKVCKTLTSRFFYYMYLGYLLIHSTNKKY